MAEAKASIEQTVESIASAASWDERVALIRRIPESFGTASHKGIYAAVAKRVYLPSLAPDFAFVHWREDYELPVIEQAYAAAVELTAGFTQVEAEQLTAAMRKDPRTVRIFRLLLGLTTQEFAAATGMVAEQVEGLHPLTNSRVKSVEEGGAVSEAVARACASVVDAAMAGSLFAAPSTAVRSKLDKPDTVAGWESVRKYAKDGVPLPMFLHQRYYGGAFRQLLDATSTKRGDILEDAVEALFVERGVPFVRTGSNNQEEVAQRFGLTVRPAPDFVIFSGTETLRAMLECKGANDGGTARDKASRFRALRGEAMRLGGTPLFAVLGGLGWARTADALGPVVRDTDGRTFTVPTLEEMLTVQPFPELVGSVAY
jgi:hypothetical protein